MIEKLTPEQEEKLIEFKNECLKIGLSTEPIKRDAAEHQDLIDYIYKNHLSLPPPKIWYVDSPLMFNLILNFSFFDNEKDNLRTNLEANLRTNLWANLRT